MPTRSVPAASTRLAALITLVLMGALTLVAFAAPASAATAAAPYANVCGYSGSEPTLSQGSSGNAVKEAQCQLNLSLSPATHPRLSIDGQFGPRTTQAVRSFQACAGISVDGVIGPVTWSYLRHWATSPYYVC
jgi:peptidoglycan hydrolase-like protein with peptidoglycan-binding domain